MLEIILDRHVLFVLMGILTVLGIVSKCIANVTLKRLVRAAGNMNKSTHPLMRLVRAKFEHACMVSDKVENVRVFVDKYLYEYRVLGMKLHGWRRMENITAGLCLVLGAGGALLEYLVNGMGDMVLRTGATGAGLAILIYLVHLITDERYQLEAVQNYMVDYLENVCLHRYEKTYQKEIKVMAQEGSSMEFGVMPEEKNETPDSGAGQEIASPSAPRVVTPRPEEMPQPSPQATPQKVSQITPQATPQTMAQTPPQSIPQAAPQMQAVSRDKESRKGKLDEVEKDVLIRQILEEFMA